MKNQTNNSVQILINKLANATPSAQAQIFGRDEYATIKGNVDFYNFNGDSVVACLVQGLPETATNIFGFHIHENGDCSGDFSSSGGHYGGNTHPEHKGDMPVLFSNNGNAFLVFCTDRFTIDEIIDRAVIIHLMPDDYTTQPAGNSGTRIACGIIQKI